MQTPLLVAVCLQHCTFNPLARKFTPSFILKIVRCVCIHKRTHASLELEMQTPLLVAVCLQHCTFNPLARKFTPPFILKIVCCVCIHKRTNASLEMQTPLLVAVCLQHCTVNPLARKFTHSFILKVVRCACIHGRTMRIVTAVQTKPAILNPKCTCVYIHIYNTFQSHVIAQTLPHDTKCAKTVSMRQALWHEQASCEKKDGM